MLYYNIDTNEMYDVLIRENDNNLNVTSELMENGNFEYDEELDVYIGDIETLGNIEGYMEELREDEDNRYWVVFEEVNFEIKIYDNKRNHISTTKSIVEADKIINSIISDNAYNGIYCDFNKELMLK